MFDSDWYTELSIIDKPEMKLEKLEELTGYSLK
jgi:hypothetical protein